MLGRLLSVSGFALPSADVWRDRVHTLAKLHELADSRETDTHGGLLIVFSDFEAILIDRSSGQVVHILNAALVAELDKGPDVLVVKFKRPFREFSFFFDLR